MSIRVKKEDLFKREKLEIPKELKEKSIEEEYDLDSIGDALIMMPKLTAEIEDKNKIKNNIKKEWLED